MSVQLCISVQRYRGMHVYVRVCVCARVRVCLRSSVRAWFVLLSCRTRYNVNHHCICLCAWCKHITFLVAVVPVLENLSCAVANAIITTTGHSIEMLEHVPVFSNGECISFLLKNNVLDMKLADCKSYGTRMECTSVLCC